MNSSHGKETDLSRKTLCYSCGKTLLNEESLTAHLARGCPMLPCRVCMKCGDKFATEAEMCVHMNTVHCSEIALKKWLCPVCDDEFYSPESHDEHLFSEHQVDLAYSEKTFDSFGGKSTLHAGFWVFLLIVLSVIEWKS